MVAEGRAVEADIRELRRLPEVHKADPPDEEEGGQADGQEGQPAHANAHDEGDGEAVFAARIPCLKRSFVRSYAGWLSGNV